MLATRGALAGSMAPMDLRAKAVQASIHVAVNLAVTVVPNLVSRVLATAGGPFRITVAGLMCTPIPALAVASRAEVPIQAGAVFQVARTRADLPAAVEDTKLSYEWRKVNPLITTLLGIHCAPAS